MNEIVKFLEKLNEDLSDVTWNIWGLTDYKKVTENENVYAELPDGSAFDEQDGYYIFQTQQGEDYFSGTIIYPITDSKAVVIYYDC